MGSEPPLYSPLYKVILLKPFLMRINCVARERCTVINLGRLVRCKRVKLEPNAITLMRKQQMAIQVVRKLFRLWLVLSLVWIGGVAFQTWRDIPRDDWVPAGIFHPIIRVFIEHGMKLAFIPPGIILASGFVFIWAFRRFRL